MSHALLLPAGEADDVVVLIPVFNDWESLTVLLVSIASVLSAFPARVLVIDDGSTTTRPEHVGGLEQTALRVDVVTLRRNLGHQRAIAIGLALIERELACSAVVVMDGDGEDAPADVVRLLAATRADDGDATAVVFAERTKRSESFTFRVGYFAYRVLHRALTGIAVRVGNFSVIPRPTLSRLVVSADLWNHYAAAVVRARVPMKLVPTARAERIAGTSRMNFVALVAHGLSAMTVFGDRVAVRLLVACTAIVATLATFGVVLAVGAALGADLVPGSGGLGWLIGGVALLQLIALLFVFVFVVLGNRDQTGFVPLRDFEVYVMRTEAWHEAS